MSQVIATREHEVVREVRLQFVVLLSVVSRALETNRGAHVELSGDVFYTRQDLSYNIKI